MSPGSYISFALHLGFVGWLVLNGDFSRKPSEMSVADVSYAWYFALRVIGSLHS